jgi:ATP-binding cassette subfamily G (WHITE) protein 2 (SNQ2)
MADALMDVGNLNDGEKQHTPGSTTPNTLISQQVDVAQAEAEFNALSRQLTKRSELARQQSKSQSSVTATLQQDVEKARVDEFDRFDLREYLTSSNDANQKAGIKHKVCSVVTLRLMGLISRALQHVGVVWEDLQVEVMGGINSKVMKFSFHAFNTLISS